MIALLTLLFLGGVTGGYLYFSKVMQRDKAQENDVATNIEDLTSLRVYYPVENHLLIEERRVPRQTGQIAIAEAAMQEYLKGPANTQASLMPKNVKLLGIYKGADRILYIDLSDEFRRNFQGDVMTEFLLLKGIYESIISNVEDIQDVKVLIEGKEVETLGGHLYLMHPLKEVVSYEY
jgi:spore germination protein GerM